MSYENRKMDTSLGAQAPDEVTFLEKLTASLEKINFTFNNITHKISSVLLFFLMFLTTADVIGRYFFNKPITGTYELTALFLAVIIFFSLGMTQIKNNHIEIDFLTNKFPEKIQHALAAVASFLLFGLLILTTWQLWELTKRNMASHAVSGDLGLPLHIFTILAMIGALLFTLSYLVKAFQSVVQVVKKDES